MRTTRHSESWIFLGLFDTTSTICNWGVLNRNSFPKATLRIRLNLGLPRTALTLTGPFTNLAAWFSSARAPAQALQPIPIEPMLLPYRRKSWRLRVKILFVTFGLVLSWLLFARRRHHCLPFLASDDCLLEKRFPLAWKYIHPFHGQGGGKCELYVCRF